MNFQHVNTKLFVEGELNVDLQRFIGVFHQWIAEGTIPRFMIDVADYRHVFQGPKVMLVGHEEDYTIDNSDGAYGLHYNRKAPLEGTNADRFLHSLRSAEDACRLLEAEVDGLKFGRSRLELTINDRALAPNDRATREVFEDEVTSFLQDVVGASDFRLESSDDLRRRLGVTVELSKPIEMERISAVA